MEGVLFTEALTFDGRMYIVSYDAFSKAYNNFDYRPLTGKGLEDFYVDDFTKDTVKSINSTVKITERFRKILVIGHTGCGKSTILNKVAEELKEDYHVISFSIADQLNLMDIETIDILMVIYMQLIRTAKSLGIERPLIQRFEEFIKNNFALDEVGLDLLRIFSFKIKVEPESREKLRKVFKSRLEVLQQNISESCEAISKIRTFKLTHESFENMDNDIISVSEDIQKSLRSLEGKEYSKEEDFIKEIRNVVTNKKELEKCEGVVIRHARLEKDILVIIDDLDKLSEKPAEQIFCQETDLLTMLNAKVIFTFPLSTYYSPSFVQIRDKFTDEFIRLVNLYTMQGEYLETSLDMLKKVILKRIDTRYITDDAMKYLIDYSGGLLRDLINFMQDACKIAINEGVKLIDNHGMICQKVVQVKINEYYRVFDFTQYTEDVQEIIKNHKRTKIPSENLIHLLRYRFILEYGKLGEQSWYDAQPCLKECFLRQKDNE